MSASPPALSIILPAFRVQAYLRPCLDSILCQSFTDIEVVAVDDHSPDRCGEIFDEYAAADPRVRVVHLGENVGLGEARNIGLDHAAGDYVWFVDSDDWLAEGALEAIASRLRETCPDVLFFDYARTYWTGKVQRNVLNYLFREPPPPDFFTLRERPSVMQLIMTAWNKAIRRRFLVDLGLRFGRGYYEDIPVTYPILMAAERISMLDRVCYYYRQRRGGAITKTTNERHFEVFDQYEQVFAFMDRQAGQVDRFRPVMFDRMLWHYLIILGRGDRVPGMSRARFFHRIAEHYRRFRPQHGHVRPGGTTGMKYRLLERDSYRAFAALKVARQVLLALRAQRSTWRRRARRLASRARTAVLRVYYQLQLRLPLDDHLAVYAAYWYRGYACNPAAIYEKARELAPGVHGVWIVKPSDADSLPDGADHVAPNTRRYYRVLARAKYLINNVNFPNEIVKRPGSVHVQTQHGTPLKKMGLDLQDYPVGANRMSFANLLMRSDRWDFNISSNRFSTQVWERVYPSDYETLESGYPRNDRLCTATPEDVAQARARLGLRPDQTVVLYAPTFRDYQQRFEPVLDLARLARALGDDAVLLVRAHYFYGVDDRVQELQRTGTLLDVSAHPSTEELCLAADALLTDYSSIMFDYANLDRPIVIYAHDWDTYVRCRGVYFDLLAEPPGAVATDEDELAAVFGSEVAWGSAAAKARSAFRERFCEFDDGRAAERVVRRVFLGEPITPPAVLPAKSPPTVTATDG